MFFSYLFFSRSLTCFIFYSMPTKFFLWVDDSLDINYPFLLTAAVSMSSIFKGSEQDDAFFITRLFPFSYSGNSSSSIAIIYDFLSTYDA